MNKEFGTEAKNCFASISPAIGICCYEVDIELANSFEKEFKLTSRLRNMVATPFRVCIKNNNIIQKISNKKAKLNLKEINKLQLIESNVKESSITVSNYCTNCNKTLFFSYRRDGKNTGRHLAIICQTLSGFL